MRKVPSTEFWITNISNRDVMLRDLSLSIKRGQTRNLLDSKHYTYSREQLDKSAQSGSLFLKSNMIKVRIVQPGSATKEILDIYKDNHLRKEVPKVNDVYIDHSNELYNLPTDDRDEVKRIQEKFAEENIDFDLYDHAPAGGLIVDPALKR